jgi:hypothetical protein
VSFNRSQVLVTSQRQRSSETDDAKRNEVVLTSHSPTLDRERAVNLIGDGLQSDCPPGLIGGQSAGHQSPCGSVVCPTSMM